MDWLNGEKFTQRNEGCRLDAYQDTRGIWTIGYGDTGTLPDGTVIGPGVTISQATADDMFVQRYQRAFVAASADVGNAIFNCLNEPRQAALVDMAYNLGGAGLAEFRQFLGYVALAEWDLAVDAGYHSQWAKQVPNRAKAVLDIISSGEWPSWISPSSS